MNRQEKLEKVDEYASKFLEGITHKTFTGEIFSFVAISLEMEGITDRSDRLWIFNYITEKYPDNPQTSEDGS